MKRELPGISRLRMVLRMGACCIRKRYQNQGRCTTRATRATERGSARSVPDGAGNGGGGETRAAEYPARSDALARSHRPLKAAVGGTVGATPPIPHEPQFDSPIGVQCRSSR
jgi:hypothetical protein